jgi:diguanylate cyclase (GGDEF)-like protein
MGTIATPALSTWLCPDTAARERLLDMDERIKQPRAAAFGVLGAAVAASVPVVGWRPVGLLLVAVLGFTIANRVRDRVARPEYAIVASWAFAQTIIAAAVALTGGTESYALSWFIVPLVTLPARFGPRGVAAGVVWTTVLLLIVEFAVTPGQDVPHFYATVFTVAALVAIAILSTALMRSDLEHRTEAVIDGLTGMLNRRALAQRLEELTAQADVTGDPVSVVAIDLDHFKRINDEHGHAVGDAVLVDAAYRMRKQLRAFDLAYRIGGEEFLVVLPGATVGDADRLAEDLRAALADAPVGGVDVTASFGVAGTGGGVFTPDAVLARADAALYAAKAAGRDRVVVDGLVRA